MNFKPTIAKGAALVLVLAVVVVAVRLFDDRGHSSKPRLAAGAVRSQPAANPSPLAVPRAIRRTTAEAVTNWSFLTPDIRWDQPVREESFARFHDWAEQYVRESSPTAKAGLEREGIELAQKRRQELAGLIQTDPERALELAVPVRIRQAFPAELTDLMEERVSGRGRLAVLAALPEPGKEKEVIPVFRTATVGRKEYKAFVYGRRLGEPTRNNIPLNGIAVDDLLAVNEHPVRILEPEEAAEAKARVAGPICAVSGLPATVINQEVVAEVGGQPVFLCRASHVLELDNRLTAAESGGPGTSGADTGQVEASPWTEGQKNLIFIRVDFSDLSGVPFSDSTGASMWTTMNNFYTEMSYGRTGFTPIGGGTDITPTFRMPQPAAYYGTNDFYNQLRTDARNAAAAAGYVLTNYQFDLTCFGSVPGWSWSGLAYVGAAGAWIRNSFGGGVSSHEVGHNYGLNHANFWDTSGASIIGPGTSVEYGDIYDTMGNAGAGIYHFNARNKAYLNWLTTNDWVNVTSNGTYRIACHDDANSTGWRALRVVKNSGTNYWVELRQKFTSNKWLMSGAGLRRAQNGNERSQLLDTTPSSVDGKNDSAIVIGRTFADPDSAIYITALGLGNTTPQSLDVAVNLGPFPANTAPTVTVSASATNAAQNATLNFTAAASDAEGDPLAYYWDFGDDSFGANSPTASHSWSGTGEYLVQCVVTDMKGGEARDSVIIDIGSPTTYRISGQVATTNAPLEGVRVYVSTTRMTYTDSDGAYTLVGLPAGTYTVAASLYEYAFANSGFSNPVSVGPNATNINFLATALGSNTPPTITTQPLSQTVNPGATASFSVVATGTLPLGYQWRFNGGNIAGATSSSYTKSNVQVADGGNYSVVVSNIAGTVTSATAVLTVNTPPSITAQPQSQTVIAGNNATFTVTASGIAPLYYQWRSSGTNIPGATGSSYTRANVQLADAGSYLVVVTNSVGSVTSAPASLTVNFGLVATAAYGGIISKSPDQPNYPPNSIVTLTASPVTVFPFTGWSGDASGTNNPLTVLMTSNKTIVANFTSPVADIILDNPAATFTGSWSLAGAASDEYGPNYNVIGTVNHGTLATATFAPSIGTAGRYNVYLWFPTISSGFNAAQFIISDVDGAVTNSVDESTGSGGWKLLAMDTAFGQGAAGFVRLNNGGSPNKNVVADAVRWVYSENQLAPPVIVVAPQDQSVVAGQAAAFSVVASGTTPLSYQWRLDGSALSGATTSSLTISNTQPADAGSYTVVVTNEVGSITSAVALLTIIVPPGITVQPQDQTVIAGQTATFSVAATGTAPLSYQWQFSAMPLSGATNSMLIISNAQPADAGAYVVMVTNIVGSVTSAVATLTVNVPPTITAQPQGQSVLAGQTANFSVTATGTLPLAYEWWLNGSPISGATNSVLTVPSAQLPDAGAYTVIVTNVAGSITSSVATLTVKFTLTATATYGGRVTKDPDQPSYPGYTAVTLTASPVSVFPFAGWSGDANGTNNPLTVILTTNLTITANFTSPVQDIVIDNPAAAFTGSWATGTAADQYGTDYASAATSQNNPTATATFTPNFSSAGRYDVYLWFPPITKGLSSAQFILTDSGGSTTNSVNQSTGSGGWFLLSSYRNFAQGTNGFVRLINLGQPSKNVVADAARWVYNENQAASPPAIIGQPTNQAVIAGQTANFNVAATGTTPLSYQWRLNGANLVGTPSTASLTITNAQPANAGPYTVVVTNVAGSVTSAVATLTVLVPPTIGQQPQDVWVLAGSNASFGVAASGTAPLSYQWQKDGANLSDGGTISGAALPTLTISNVQGSDVGQYAVVITNLAGSATSGAAMLYMGYEADVAPWPNGNNVVSATDWTQIGRFVAGLDSLAVGSEFMRADCSPRSSSGNGTISVSDWVQAGRYAAGLDSPAHAGGPMAPVSPQLALASLADGGAALDVQASTSRVVRAVSRTLARGQSGEVAVELAAQGDENAVAFSFNFDAAQLNYQTTVAGTEATNATLTVNTNDAASGRLGIVVLLPAGQTFPAGTNQLIRAAFLAVQSGAETNLSISLGDTPVLREVSNANADPVPADYQSGTVSLVLPPTITAQPQSQTNCPNTTASFSVTATGTAPLSYQWRLNGTNVSGATNTTFTITSVQASNAGTYSVGVTNVGGSATSSNAVLTVNVPTTANGPSAATVCQGSTASFSTVAAGTGPFSYTWTLDGAGTGTNGPNLSVATGSLSVGSHTVAVAVSGACGSVTNSTTLTVQANTTASGPSAATVCQANTASFSTVAAGTGPFSYAWTLDGAATGTNGPNLGVATGGLSVGIHAVAVAVSGTCGSVTNSATLTVNQLSAATPLTGLTRTVGESATFSTTASGAGPLSYQWRKDGTGIGAATSSSYTIASVTTNDAGTYTVEVTGACNSVTNSATLTVNVPPSIAGQPQSLSVGFASNATFTVTASGTALLSYQWRMNVTNLADGSNVNGALSSILTITNAQYSNAGDYSVVVTNVAGSVTSQVASLLVGFEADVTPRPNGDNRVTTTDWVQIGRFVAALDPLPTGSEFMRADCAPRSSLGNGTISVTDWVQAGRYVAALDPLLPAGGPTGPAGPAFRSFSAAGSSQTDGNDPPADGPGRAVYFTSGTLFQGQDDDVFVELLAEGEENALAFSVGFDPQALRFKGAVAAIAGLTLNVNTNGVGTGQLGMALAFPAGQVFMAGTNTLVRLTFSAALDGSMTNTALGFGDVPVFREISSALATPLPADYYSAVLALAPPPAFRIDSAMILTNGALELTVAGNVRQNYSVEASTNLAQWTSLVTLTNVAGLVRYTDSTATNFDQRFYRLRLVP
jgi:hypothetical protein